MSTTRALIIYGSVYGYTEQYATWLAEDLRALPQAPEVETVPAAKVTPEQAEAADVVVIGGSDYGGFLTGAPLITQKDRSPLTTQAQTHRVFSPFHSLVSTPRIF